MHRQLETYLADVAEYLSLIPAKERAEELREMRAHLEQIVAQHRENGLSEDDAVALTLERFGEPNAVSHDLVMAWQRGEAIKNKRCLWSAAACVVVLSLVTGVVSNLLIRTVMISHCWPANANPFQKMCLLGFIIGLNVVFRVVAGGFSGFLFPRRAVAGTVIGMAGWCVYETIQAFQNIARLPHRFLTPTILAQAISFYLVSILIVSLGVTLLSAWIGSRWRKRQNLALAQ